MLEPGSPAPAFTLPDQNGRPVSLSDYRGRRLILYFYPKDSSPDCTRQALAFAAAWARFREAGIEVVGVSPDSVASHQRFAEKYALPFPLLSDPERLAIEAYGVWQEKKRAGKPVMGVVRSTYVIDAEGVVEKGMEKVKPDSNAVELLAYFGL
ncbi:MAG: peroxiredoxin [Oscillospiraceae bacterium]|nr:peroxiredoxin [Oscillospiraceae bacterium]